MVLSTSIKLSLVLFGSPQVASVSLILHGSDCLHISFRKKKAKRIPCHQSNSSIVQNPHKGHCQISLPDRRTTHSFSATQAGNADSTRKRLSAQRNISELLPRSPRNDKPYFPGDRTRSSQLATFPNKVSRGSGPRKNIHRHLTW
uniref:Secreted protein n=1 Tax=Steinernema glaseri TaxID=37863 RepID=A0A1I7YYS6_9BILA